MRRAQLILLLLLTGGAAHADVMLITDPLGGAITGDAGTTVGWGFTLSSDAGFALVTNADFCPGGIITSPCSSALGMFSGFINNNFVGADPSSSPVSESFDLILQRGFGSFAINPGTLPGETETGLLIFNYDLYDFDPRTVDEVNLISSDNLFTTNGSVTVGGGGMSAVPEPTIRVLLATVLLAVAAVAKLAPRRIRLLRSLRGNLIQQKD